MEQFLSLDESTLQPGALAALGLRDEKRRWARSQPHGIEYYAYTARGGDRHGNEDAWWVAIDDDGTHHFGVFDEISQKRGIGATIARDIVVRAVAATTGPPEERLAQANAALWHHLQQATTVDRKPRAGVCAALVSLMPNGRLRWAALGDCAVAIDRSAGGRGAALSPWWCRWGRHRSGRELLHGDSNPAGTPPLRLAAALGCAATNRIDCGRARLHAGDTLWLGSDGSRIGIGSRRQPNLTLAAGIEAQLSAARLTGAARDDATVVVVGFRC